jgi:NADPH2:quinone reductase
VVNELYARENEAVRAAWYEKQGPAKQVIKIGEMAAPDAGPGEVRVKVAYSGLNPSDIKRRQGFRGQQLGYPRIIPHSDGAGVIDQVGRGVPKSRIGEKVWIWCGQWQRPFGTCAQYIALPSRHAITMPRRADVLHGACLGIPAVTAHRALFADGPIKGKTVLVTGGAGAVGNYAIQLAKWGGAKLVLATVSSPAKARHAKAAGADVVINYKTQDVAKRVMRATNGAGVDHIVEVAFGINQPTILEVMKQHTTIACYASDKKPEPVLNFYPFMQRNANLRWIYMYEIPDAAYRQATRDITAWLSRGKPHHPVAKVFPLSRTADAHAYLQSGKANGNVIVAVDK